MPADLTPDLRADCLAFVRRIAEYRCHRAMDEDELPFNVCDYYAMDDLAARLAVPPVEHIVHVCGYCGGAGWTAEQGDEGPIQVGCEMCSGTGERLQPVAVPPAASEPSDEVARAMAQPSQIRQMEALMEPTDEEVARELNLTWSADCFAIALEQVRAVHAARERARGKR